MGLQLYKMRFIHIAVHLTVSEQGVQEVVLPFQGTVSKSEVIAFALKLSVASSIVRSPSSVAASPSSSVRVLGLRRHPLGLLAASGS